MGDDQRRRSRTNVGFDAVIKVEDCLVQVKTRNLSLKGLLCTPSPLLKPGKECSVTITLSNDTQLTIQAVVIRADAVEAALDFQRMDEASFIHLRNIVVLNLGDPDLVDREMTNPAFDD